MIRVLQVLGALDRGGAETMVMNLYRNIDRSKIQFDFVIHTERKCDYTDEIEAMGGKIYSVQRYKGYNHFPYVNEWKRFFEKHTEYRIVHAHIRSTASIILNIAGKYGLFTISHSHSTSSGNGISAIVKNILQYSIRNVADYYFACSVQAGQWLYGKKVVSSTNFKVLKNAIDVTMYPYSVEKREKVYRELQIPDGSFVIGHVGRFVEVKNHIFLIEVFEKIYALNNKAVLLLVGDGPLMNEVMQKCKNKEFENSVFFLGGRNDVAKLLSAMDVFVFPSVYEGLGIVAIEAQAAGLHTICADTIPEEARISGLFHYLSLNDTKDRWAEEILKYSESYKREDMTSTVIEAGYDICSTAKWLQDFYENKSLSN